MGRILLVAAVLAGCTHAATTTPAWPKVHEADKDGGESLAPHESKQISVAVEKSADETKPEAKPEAKPAAVAPVEAGAPAAAAAAATQPTDEAITSEEIIIDIDE